MDLKQSDVFIMLVILSRINLKTSEVFFCFFLNKNVSYSLIHLNNSEPTVAILRNRWHTGERKVL
jgi:hypothetical protein